MQNYNILKVKTIQYDNKTMLINND